MAGGFSGLGSLFGLGQANANPLGALAGLGGGQGSGLGAGQSIGSNNVNDTIAQALGWTYGVGDPSGSLTAQEVLAQGADGGDGTGPTALGTANQYMQQQQQQTGQNAQAQVDTGQPTPAQQSMAQQPPVSLAQAYGAQGPWAPGGSPSPGAATQGPQAFPQVAGPAQAATGPGGQAGMPSQQPVPNFFSSPQGYNLPGSAGPAGSAARGTMGLGGITDAINAQRGVATGELPGWATQNITSPMRSTQSLAAPTSPDQSAVPLPQPRPVAADQAPAPAPQPRPAAAGATPAAPRVAPPTAPAVDPYTGRAAPQGQGAPQNPIQGIMQALGLQNLPPQMQQAAQQIIQQILSQFMPQLQGLMGGQQGQMPYGGGHNWAVDPRTGQPIRDRQTGQPLRWDQIPWSRGYDPAQQKQGVPWTRWQNEPPQDPISRSPSESGAPTGGQPEKYSRTPAPSKGMPPPRVLVPSGKGKTKAVDPDKVAQLSPDQVPPSLEGPLSRSQERREQRDLNRDPRSMSPEQMKKLRDMLKRREDEGRRVVGQSVLHEPPHLPESRRPPIRMPQYTGPRQPVITEPPPGIDPQTGMGTPWGYNQPFFDPYTGRMIRPNPDPNRDMGTTYMNPGFRGM